MMSNIKNSINTYAHKIPKAEVSADTVGDLINQMRGEDGQQQAPPDEASAENAATQPEKKTVIPKAIVSVDSELSHLRALLKSGRDLEIDSSGRIVAAGSPPPTVAAKNDLPAAKAKTIPKTVVSADTVGDLINQMRGQDGQQQTPPDEATAANAANQPEKKSVIPKAVVSAPQWYETNRALYNAEVAAMRKEFHNPNLQPRFLPDGRMYWVVNTRPNLGKDSHGKEYPTMTYKLLLVYDSDHPQVRYGSSVKVYPISPSIDEMQSRVNRLPSVPPTKKNIPHVLSDASGNKYLCSADTVNVSADISKGITSAVTSYRFAYRWLTVFELGLLDPDTWNDFQGHGKI